MIKKLKDRIIAKWISELSEEDKKKMYYNLGKHLTKRNIERFKKEYSIMTPIIMNDDLRALEAGRRQYQRNNTFIYE